MCSQCLSGKKETTEALRTLSGTEEKRLDSPQKISRCPNAEDRKNGTIATGWPE